MTEPPRRYLFNPLERRGVLLGLQWVQMVTLFLGLLSALAVLRAAPAPIGRVLAAVVVLTAAAVAMVPRAGQPLAAWLPLGVRWLARATQRTTKSPAPLEGAVLVWRLDRTGPGRDLPTRSHGARRPGGGRRSFEPAGAGPSGIRLLELAGRPGQPAIGIVHDTQSGTWGAVLPVTGRSFALLDPEQQVQRLDAWRSVLTAVGRPGSPIRRVQWVERGILSDASGPTDVVLPAARPPETRVRTQASYRELVEGRAPGMSARRVLLVLTVDHSARIHGRTEEVIRREMRLLEGHLRQADLRPGPPLGHAELCSVMAGAYDPRREGRGQLQGTEPWPMATAETWSSFRADDRWHATYWIAEWPRVEVNPDFLFPLLVPGEERTLSLTMAPVAPDRAMREARSARTADLADAELRSRAGFLPSARRGREADGVVRREAELADGHVEFRFSGYVTASAPDPEHLQLVCAELEQAAQASRLELRRLFSRQMEAFAWTLPLGRGLA
jgi:hypothetical protein